ncbi:YicC family protein [Cardiobacteriaceae bacterium TAE3-ERU3]|nr:YicC family protein [Cardiobacteriaceae bacterium TAE3-ERU3]
MRHGMTAFARVYQQIGDYRVQVEVRSVNHRYLELSPRIGEHWRHLEAPMRERLQRMLKRGKVDFWLTVEAAGQAALPSLNESVLQMWIERLEAHRYESLGKPDWSVLLKLPGVLNDSSEAGLPDDEAIMAVFAEAVDELLRVRAAEGEAMASAINERLDSVAEQVAAVRAHYPQVQAKIEQDLRDKIAVLQIEIDQQRFEQELVYLLSHADVAEEIDRLDFHVAETRKTLAQKGSIGRRLDFLMQEFNREANTLGSKSSDQLISRAAVDLKVLIEQMREQVQNIE